MKTKRLDKNTTIPLLGFGTWRLQGENGRRAVTHALKTGYRHIDTASHYGNHQVIGEVIKESGVPREKLFITSKLWLPDLPAEKVKPALKQSLQELQTDYLDLYLIHWPDKSVDMNQTLKEMDRLKKQGLIKAIGVSNFTINHLKDAFKSGVEITNNQVEFHPSLYQKELLDFCNENGISLTAYSPIAQGNDLRLPQVQKLAEKYERSPAQVVINWLLSKEIIAIPRSKDPKHIKDNFKALEWELKPEDVAKLDQADENYRLVDPGFGEFDY